MDGSCLRDVWRISTRLQADFKFFFSLSILIFLAEGFL